MFVNKMDREGADYRRAMDTVKRKLCGSNPIVLQLPLFRRGSPTISASITTLDTLEGIVAGGSGDDHGEFVGVNLLMSTKSWRIYLNAMMEDIDDKDDGLDRYPQWRYNRRCDG
jgi:translation elongation factor EF-G